ncbi:MAG TPA: DUF4430 domain-containing protein [Bacilli bacterium]|nr:DUF4430 domain-containing protein [Bacilli bacterium]
MQNKTKIILSVIVGIVVICAVIITTILLTNKSQAKSDGYITIIVVDEEGKEIVNKKVGFHKRDTFVSVLEKNLNITFESYPGLGRFIVSIEGKAQSGNYFWTYTRNDELTTTGVDLQEFEDGDVFRFSLISWEENES